MICILLLDICPVNKGLEKDGFMMETGIPEKIIILSPLENITCNFQPVDMGIIDCLKV